jgi:heme exporter protein D
MDIWLVVALMAVAATVLIFAGVLFLDRRANLEDEVDRSRRRHRDRELDALEGPHKG